MTIKKILVTILMVIMVTSLYAQSTGDVLYSQGIEAQKVHNTASQKKAIDFFTKAKVAYDSPDNKAKCDQKISECNKNIQRYAQHEKEKHAREKGDALYNFGLTNLQQLKYPEALNDFMKAKDTYLSSEDKNKCQEKIDTCTAKISELIEAAKAKEQVVEEPEDYIRIIHNDRDIADIGHIVVFQNKKNQNAILKIEASRDDWSCENSSPEWLTVEKKDISGTTLSLYIPDKSKKARTARLTFTSGNKTVEISITQDGNLWNKMGNMFGAK